MRRDLRVPACDIVTTLEIVSKHISKCCLCIHKWRQPLEPLKFVPHACRITHVHYANSGQSIAFLANRNAELAKAYDMFCS